MKSYLTGNPEIKLALNDELSIGRDGRSIYGTLELLNPSLKLYSS